MAAERTGNKVQLSENGEVLAVADVQSHDPNIVRATLHARAGHTPVGTRSRLVDAVLDQPEAGERSRLEATVPLGDAEALERIRTRCADVQTRPAGTSCLIDADLPGGGGSEESGERQ
jgi:hypothetical protein